MDMPMKVGMEDKKDPTFKCPSCGEMLSVESKDESDSEHKMVSKKPNAAKMPMSDLKSKIAPTSNPPGIVNPNLSTF